MKFTFDKTTFSPEEIIKSPLQLVICLLFFIFFTNVLTMWADVFDGQTYGYYDNFKTLNGEFERSIIISKTNKAEKALSELDLEFNKFKKNNPQYQNLILYRTGEYYNIKPWMFWKWYRYLGIRKKIVKYPYLNDESL